MVNSMLHYRLLVGVRMIFVLRAVEQRASSSQLAAAEYVDRGGVFYGREAFRKVRFRFLQRLVSLFVNTFHDLVEIFIILYLPSRHVINHLVSNGEVVVYLALADRLHTVEQVGEEAHQSMLSVEEV